MIINMEILEYSSILSEGGVKHFSVPRFSAEVCSLQLRTDEMLRILPKCSVQ